MSIDELEVMEVLYILLLQLLLQYWNMVPMARPPFVWYKLAMSSSTGRCRFVGGLYGINIDCSTFIV